jgi:hypothetical protein
VELCDCFKDYGETTAELALLFTFVLLGTSLIWQGIAELSLPMLAFAALVLFGRPAIYGLALWPTRIDRASRGWIAWFGPRGLSSVLLVLLPVFAGVEGGERAFAPVALVVLLSVAPRRRADVAGQAEGGGEGCTAGTRDVLITSARVAELRAGGADVRLRRRALADRLPALVSSSPGRCASRPRPRAGRAAASGCPATPAGALLHVSSEGNERPCGARAQARRLRECRALVAAGTLAVAGGLAGRGYRCRIG